MTRAELTAVIAALTELNNKMPLQQSGAEGGLQEVPEMSTFEEERYRRIAQEEIKRFVEDKSKAREDDRSLLKDELKQFARSYIDEVVEEIVEKKAITMKDVTAEVETVLGNQDWDEILNYSHIAKSLDLDDVVENITEKVKTSLREALE